MIPSIDCVYEHLQDSFDFYSVRVAGIGRRVQRVSRRARGGNCRRFVRFERRDPRRRRDDAVSPQALGPLQARLVRDARRRLAEAVPCRRAAKGQTAATFGSAPTRRCAAVLDRIETTRADHLTIHQCERVIREIEVQKCDKFLRQAEVFLKKNDADAAAAAAPPRPAANVWFTWLSCCTAPELRAT